MGYLDYIAEIEAEERSDEEILAASIGDPALFEVLVDRYQDAFVRNVRKVLGNREEVIDVVQEAFTKIYMNASRFKKVEGAKFSSWAYKILFNTSFTYYQKLKKKEGNTTMLEDEIWDIIPDINVEDLGKKTVRDSVARAISKMPEGLARMLTLHFIEDRPQKEIAEMEGISVSAVKTRIHRAKKIFKGIHE